MRASIDMLTTDFQLAATGNRNAKGGWQLRNDDYTLWSYMTAAELRAAASHLADLADDLAARERALAETPLPLEVAV